jgi:hypothetical protein
MLPEVAGELGERVRDATRRVPSLLNEVLLVVLVCPTRVACYDVHDVGENLGDDRVTLGDACQSLFRPHFEGLRALKNRWLKYGAESGKERLALQLVLESSCHRFEFGEGSSEVLDDLPCDDVGQGQFLEVLE